MMKTAAQVPSNPVDIAVVGAGAAGLAAVIFAARRLPKCHIVALDGAKKLGAKILVAGGGRCNVTNERVEAADFWGGSRNTIKQVLAAFPARAAADFFREIGVAMHVEEHGKLFPDTNSAKTVLNALLNEVRRLNVELLTDTRVLALSREGDDFVVDSSQGSLRAKAVVLATGGLSLPKTGSDGGGYALALGRGHTLVGTTPALVPLLLDGDFHSGLSGLSLDVELDVQAEGQKPLLHRGALLWTHFGVSGPAAMDVSRLWHRARVEDREVEIFASFFPGSGAGKVEDLLMKLAQTQPRTTLENSLATLIPARLSQAVLKELNIEPRTQMAHLAKDVRHRLAEALTHWPLPVRDSRGYNFAEVTAGGVRLSEIDLRTMESRVCPGLFLVGEILDVDGRIGGFNFQWAWSSGYVAGLGMEKYLAAR